MKKVYLLDTNIVSEFVKQVPDKNVIALYEARKNLCAISSVTWQEMKFGASRMPEGKRKASITAFIENLRNNIEIISYDDFAGGICGDLLGKFEKKGEPLPYCDTQIAATAIANGMVLITHNMQDFEPFAAQSFLKMEDWFSA